MWKHLNQFHQKSVIDNPAGAEKVPPVTPDKLGVGSVPDWQ